MLTFRIIYFKSYLAATHSIVNVAKLQSVFVVFPQYIVMLLILPRLFIPIRQAILHLFNFTVSHNEIAVPDFSLADKDIFFQFIAIFFQFNFQQVSTNRAIEIHPQLRQDLVEGMVLLLHFLVVATTLLGLACSDEICHAFEYFVCASQIFQYKMAVVQLQEPMVKFVLFVGPMPLLYIFGLALCQVVLQMWVFLLSLLFSLFSCQSDVTLFAEE